MTKAQRAAINNYCEEYGCTRKELLDALKDNGTVEHDTTLEELGKYAKGSTYDAMMCFLEANI